MGFNANPGLVHARVLPSHPSCMQALPSHARPSCMQALPSHARPSCMQARFLRGASPELLPFTRYAFSALIGGMGYFHGSSLETRADDDPQPGPAVALFSAVPCRYLPFPPQPSLTPAIRHASYILAACCRTLLPSTSAGSLAEYHHASICRDSLLPSTSAGSLVEYEHRQPLCCERPPRGPSYVPVLTWVR